MRILVTGAHGQLGRALLYHPAVADHTVVGVDLPDGDLAAAGVAASFLDRHRPEQVIHAAAYTAVDLAESQRDLAEAGNTAATRNLARACDEAVCPLTYISTDYVFAGDQPEGYNEDAPRSPLNWYGDTKARGEEAVLAMATASRVVRTSWLFGHGPTNFVLTIRRLLAERKVLRVVDDQVGSPTYAPDLAALLLDLVPREAWGVFHGTNAGTTTWYGFAREIASALGLDPDRIEACRTEEYPTPAPRPACSILHDTRLEMVGVPPAPSWQDALARYLSWLQTEETGTS